MLFTAGYPAIKYYIFIKEFIMTLKYLQKGDIIEVKKGMKVYSAKNGGRPLITEISETGEYAVIEAGSTGQGSGYDGSVDAAVIYPDGYKIICKKLKDGKYDSEGTEIFFYQSGCFSAVISPAQIQPAGRINL